MATQKPKNNKAPKESQADLDRSPSRKKSKPVETDDEPDVVEHPDIAKARAEKAAAKGDTEGTGPVKRKAAINDEVTKFLADVKSNSDAIAKTKKHELFANINRKAFDALVAQKDDLGGGLFRMRLGNMLRGSRSKGEKLAEKAKAAKAKAAK